MLPTDVGTAKIGRFGIWLIGVTIARAVNVIDLWAVAAFVSRRDPGDLPRSCCDRGTEAGFRGFFRGELSRYGGRDRPRHETHRVASVGMYVKDCSNGTGNCEVVQRGKGLRLHRA